jgi:glycosyltransferase involved in cell wall biosynthesis
MKICIVSNLYNPFVLGGAEKFAERLAGYLSQEHEVTVVTTSPNCGIWPSFESVDKIQIIRFNPLNVYHTYYADQTSPILKPLWHGIDMWNPHSYVILKRILTNLKPDVVHTNNLGGLSTSTFSAIKSQDIPHVHTLHDYQLLSPWSTLIRKGKTIQHFNFFDKKYISVKKRLCEHVSVVTAPSQFIINLHSQQGFFLKAMKKIIPLAVEPNDALVTIKQHDLIDILYVGTLVHHKGVHVLIDAFKAIEAANIRLHILGKGVAEPELKIMASQDPRIAFYGYVSDDVRGDLYRKANIVVVPSIWYDNSPTVIRESFSFGTPVIGSDIGGIPELINDGVNGLLFEPGNVDELKEKLLTLCQNVGLLKSMEMNITHSEKKQTLTEQISIVSKIYSDILG